MGTIVVGVDDSPGSRAALRWSVEKAGRLGDDVLVVHTYDYRPPWMAFASTEDMTTEQARHWRENVEGEAEAVQARAERFLTSLVAEVLAEGVDVRTLALRDRHPAEALVDQAEDAEMLVVGSRGRGGFSGLVLGSVSQQCLHHARCPVVVIPPDH